LGRSRRIQWRGVVDDSASDDRPQISFGAWSHSLETDFEDHSGAGAAPRGDACHAQFACVGALIAAPRMKYRHNFLICANKLHKCGGSAALAFILSRHCRTSYRTATLTFAAHQIMYASSWRRNARGVHANEKVK
jgi:hypothetical protein